MTRTIVFLLFLSSVLCCKAQKNISPSSQSPYELSNQDYWLVGSALILNGTAFLIRENMDAPTMAQLERLNRGDINRFDRAATYNWSPQASDWSDRTEIASIFFPLVLLSRDEGRKDALKLLLMGAEAVAINQGLTDMSKSISKRYRPFAYNDDAPLDNRLSKNARLSFYSGHTSASATFCFFTASVFAKYYPESRMKPLVWAAAITLPAVTGWLRYEAGKHYLTDVIVAYGMGAMVGTLVPKLHEREFLENVQLSAHQSGMNISYRF